MKFLPVILLASLLSACSPEPKVSGKPVSYWVERLDDLDPRTQNDAIQKLGALEAEDLEPARKRLIEIRKAGGPNANAAKHLLYTLRDFE